MKKALAHDGLARGLHESARAIERGQAQVRRGRAGRRPRCAAWRAAGAEPPLQHCHAVTHTCWGVQCAEHAQGAATGAQPGRVPPQCGCQKRRKNTTCILCTASILCTSRHNPTPAAGHPGRRLQPARLQEAD